MPADDQAAGIRLQVQQEPGKIVEIRDGHPPNIVGAAVVGFGAVFVSIVPSCLAGPIPRMKGGEDGEAVLHALLIERAPEHQETRVRRCLSA